ncbi:MAG: Hsp20/alpha crystallin family protein [Oscillospiraceae bacterium]|jgi:HSP20 family protein|nr:Hsp20/alpha crystallin family protein [Oscillospiraceae bacterium]MCI9586933.1 Hsp20/alpha crystallin family protein [Oscillospiraceae bacterium]
MFGMIPFERHENNLFDAFDNFERNFFGNTSSAVTFRTDIRDEGDKFVLEAELPGFRKEDIQLHLKDGILTVSAQRTASSEEKDQRGNYIRRERRFGSFARSFDVAGIDEESISAAYQDGILELTLPKAKPAAPAVRQIQIQ